MPGGTVKLKSRLSVIVGSALVAVSVIAATPAAFAAASTHPGKSHAKKLTLVKFIGGTAVGEFAAIPYGFDHGIFKKYGIALQMNWNGGNSNSSVPLLANNSFQLSGSAPTAMIPAYQSGLKTEAILGYLQENPTGISMNASLHVTKPSQLVGKTIAVGTGTSTIGILAAYLKHYGLNENEVHVVEVSLSALAPELGTKKVDGIAGFPFALDPQVNSLGVKTNNLYVSSAGINEIDEQWVVGDTWANAHPAAIKGLTKALVESTLGAIAHPDVAVRDLEQAGGPGTAPYSVNLAVWKGSEKFFSTPNDKGHPFGWQSPKDWAKTLAFGEQFLGLSGMNVSPLYTNRYLPSGDQTVK